MGLENTAPVDSSDRFDFYLRLHLECFRKQEGSEDLPRNSYEKYEYRRIVAATDPLAENHLVFRHALGPGAGNDPRIWKIHSMTASAQRFGVMICHGIRIKLIGNRFPVESTYGYGSLGFCIGSHESYSSARSLIVGGDPTFQRRGPTHQRSS